MWAVWFRMLGSLKSNFNLDWIWTAALKLRVLSPLYRQTAVLHWHSPLPSTNHPQAGADRAAAVGAGAVAVAPHRVAASGCWPILFATVRALLRTLQLSEGGGCPQLGAGRCVLPVLAQ